MDSVTVPPPLPPPPLTTPAHSISDTNANTDGVHQLVRLEEEDMTIQLRGLRRTLPGAILYWTLVVCTAGLLYVVDTWFHTISLWFIMKPAPLATAEYIQVTDEGKHLSMERVQHVKFSGTLTTVFGNSSKSSDSMELGELRVFVFRHNRFIMHPVSLEYISTSKWKDAQWQQGIVTGRHGLTSQEVNQRMCIFDSCLIDIEEKSWIRLLVEEVLNPFYVFQIASIIIWSCEDYYYYAACIFVISVVSIAVTLISTKRTVRKIKQMAAYSCPVRVLRDRKWEVIDSVGLVPGDIFDMSDEGISVLPCEAIMLEGDCIVNESMLTGESVPESKSPLDSNSNVMELIDLSTHTFKPEISRHVVFAGTKIVRVRKALSRFPRDHSATPNEGAGMLEISETFSDQLSSTVSADVASGPNARATAMVLRTGFNTTKGSLVRSIVFPRPTKFRFYRDAFRFIGVLAVIAMCGFIANTINLHHIGVSTGAIAKKALDLITVVVPPALPASMSIGMAFAARRLRKVGIFCISPSRINVASKVAVMCFDKTGTLTEEGLDLLGVHVASQETGSFVDMHSEIQHVTESITTAKDSNELQDIIGVPGITVFNALATCHSLRLVDNVPIGDPLEAKMFEFTGWQMEENEGNEPEGDQASNATPLPTVIRPPASSTVPAGLEELGILRCFEFSPALRRASVVTKRLHNKYAETYTKGAPEIIRTICRPETIPGDFDVVLDRYTQSGYRVIALAGKPLHMSYRKTAILERNEVESDLTFMGFMVFENRLKPTTAGVLKELRDAKIRMIMCTGDNPLTAVSVAKECELVNPSTTVFVSYLHSEPHSALNEKGNIENAIANPHSPLASVSWRESSGIKVALDPISLVPYATDPQDAQAVAMADDLQKSGQYGVAVTGDVFGYLAEHTMRTDTFKHILMRGTIYARMSPEQKAEMIQYLQELGYITGFCGDGANDCSALKSADMGLSLSEAEASVAAPFTSNSTDIKCVVQLLREGRCSIATSFSCFKYMAIYSMVQFTTVCLLYIYNVNLTDFQYLWADLFTIMSIAICMDRARPYKKLVPKRPSASLTSKKVLTSLIGNTLLTIGFQIAVFFLVESQSWYQKQLPVDPTDPDSVENEGDLNTAMFMLTMFQYVFAGSIFIIGPPYRESAFRNYWYVGVISLLTILDLWILLIPVGKIYSIFGIMHTTVKWRFTIFGMVVANFVACYVGERHVFPRLAIPLAKIFRLIGLGYKRLFHKHKPAHHADMPSDSVSDEKQKLTSRTSLEELGHVSQAAYDRNVSGMSLWTRLGRRTNRKPYKYLQEAMVGTNTWH